MSSAKPDRESLIGLRRALHAHPELSGHEAETVKRMRAWIGRHGADEILSGLGGHGLAASYNGAEAGPTLLLRAELDALPIRERSAAVHRSRIDGVMHACGHDGHMAMLASLAAWLAERRPRRGRVVLLFQPAEETGAGARAVIEDPAFARIRPDMACALHNLPGRPMGQVVVRAGTFAMGSVGMVVRLRGRTAHAAHPEAGLSPGVAVARLVDELPGLGDGRSRLVTVIHARLGDEAFGVSPGEGLVLATLRAEADAGLRALREEASGLARDCSDGSGIDVEIEWRDEFPATVNDAGCVDAVTDVACGQGLEVVELDEPIRWSEDFGWFLKECPGALFGIGAGVDQAALHSEEYDFPDSLLPVGARLWRGIVERALGSRA